MVKWIRAISVLLAVVFALAGCGAFDSGPKGSLEYAGATEQTIPRGQYMPGTNIQYVSNSEDGALVLIAGQQAVKKIGDSLDWQGSPMSGVSVTLAQRVINSNDERLLTAGTVKLTVDQVVVAPAQYPDKPLYAYTVPVLYGVKRGETIPGTTIGYAGKTDSGAQLTGVTGYAYRKLGDSISWEGQLRTDVYLDMTVRVVLYTDDLLQVTGLANIGLMGE